MNRKDTKIIAEKLEAVKSSARIIHNGQEWVKKVGGWISDNLLFTHLKIYDPNRKYPKGRQSSMGNVQNPNGRGLLAVYFIGGETDD